MLPTNRPISHLAPCKGENWSVVFGRQKTLTVPPKGRPLPEHVVHNMPFGKEEANWHPPLLPKPSFPAPIMHSLTHPRELGEERERAKGEYFPWGHTAARVSGEKMAFEARKSVWRGSGGLAAVPPKYYRCPSTPSFPTEAFAIRCPPPPSELFHAPNNPRSMQMDKKFGKII